MITLVTPCLNAARWIEHCIRSVIEQTDCGPVEHIIIDGGSTDGTVDIIRRFERHLAWWRSDPDGGISHAINMGLASARGEYFNWLCADDRLLPGALARLLRAGAENPDALFFGGYLTLVDESGRPIEGLAQRSPAMPPGRVLRKHALLRLRTQEQPGGLFRTDFLRAVGGADERLKVTMDQDLLLKALLLGETLLLRDSFISFCKRPDQASARHTTGRARERHITYRNLLALDREGFLTREDRRVMRAAAFHYEWNCHRKGGRPWRAVLSAFACTQDLRSGAALRLAIRRARHSFPPRTARAPKQA